MGEHMGLRNVCRHCGRVVYWRRVKGKGWECFNTDGTLHSTRCVREVK